MTEIEPYAAPPTPPPRRGLGDRLFKFAGLLVIVCSAVFGWFGYDYQHFRQSPLAVPPEGTVINIPPGRSVRGIAQDLAELQLIDNPWYFEILARSTGAAARLQAGEYRLEPGLLPESLLQLLASGKVMQHTLTIVEGWTFRQMLDAVRAHPVLTQSLRNKSVRDIMAALERKGEHPEGRFLPDTYHFPRGMTDVDFLGRAYAAMQKALVREWAERAPELPFKTAYEALILASIVEKETGIAAERPRIAGVFVRRLKQGMRLQTDPTVIYGLGERFDGDIRSNDLRVDTPYNTYTRDGLPPTPIALPGLDAIRAVLHPADGKELYFVAKGDGSHQFSATLEEHTRAVRLYQLKR